MANLTLKANDPASNEGLCDWVCFSHQLENRPIDSCALRTFFQSLRSPKFIEREAIMMRHLKMTEVILLEECRKRRDRVQTILTGVKEFQTAMPPLSSQSLKE